MKEIQRHSSLFLSELKWPVSARTLMLQRALTGRAQEAYSSLSLEDIQKYAVVKSVVLKAYELVFTGGGKWKSRHILNLPVI